MFMQDRSFTGRLKIHLITFIVCLIVTPLLGSLIIGVLYLIHLLQTILN